MNSVHTDAPPNVDTNAFNANVEQFPREELLRYTGKRVAWSLDGNRILASGDDYPQLFQDLDEKGINQAMVVLSYIPRDDEDPLI